MIDFILIGFCLIFLFVHFAFFIISVIVWACSFDDFFKGFFSISLSLVSYYCLFEIFTLSENNASILLFFASFTLSGYTLKKYVDDNY